MVILNLDRDAHAIRAVVVGVALAADRIHARAVVIRAGTRWRSQTDRFRTRARSRKTADRICAHFSIARGDRRIGRLIIAQGRRG